jgi:hypothetical protein
MSSHGKPVKKYDRIYSNETHNNGGRNKREIGLEHRQVTAIENNAM